MSEESSVCQKKQIKSVVLSDSWLRMLAGCNSEVETWEGTQQITCHKNVELAFGEGRRLELTGYRTKAISLE